MRKTLLSLLVLLSLSASAQFLQDVSGKPYLFKSDDQYQGSPLLFQAWVKANVKTADGKLYDGMLVNIDLLQDLPLFLRDNKIYTFSQEIQSFTITDSVSGHQMNFKRGTDLHSGLPDVLMEVMADTPMVVKRYNKQVIETPTYGSTGKTYRYSDGKAYYFINGGELKKITLSKDNAEKVFAKKWKAVADYSKKQNLSYKTEEGWRAMLRFYRTAS